MSSHDNTKNEVARTFKGIRVYGQVQAEGEIVLSSKKEEPVFLENENGKLLLNKHQVLSLGSDNKIQEKDIPEILLATHLSGYQQGVYSDGQVVYKFIIPNDIIIKKSSDGSQYSTATLDVAPQDDISFYIKLNEDTEVGSVMFESSENKSNIVIPDDVVLKPGDVVSIIAPSPADSVAAGLSFIILTKSLLPTAPTIDSSKYVNITGDFRSGDINNIIPGDTIWLEGNRVSDRFSNEADRYEIYLQAQYDGGDGWRWRDYGQKWIVSKEEANAPNSKVGVYSPTVKDLFERFRYKVVACNDVGSTTDYVDNTISWINQFPPENTTPPSVVGVPQYGGTLVGDRGVWNMAPEFKPLRYEYNWFKADTKDGEYTEIDGETSLTISISDGELVGKFLKLKVKAINWQTLWNEPSFSPATEEVLPILPVNTSEPEITGDVKVGEMLTVNNGTWDNDLKYGVKSYKKAWQVSSDGVNYTTIDNETSTYTIKKADIGKRFRVRVTAINKAGNTIVFSKPTIPVPEIVLNPPINITAPVVSGTYRVGQTLETTTGEWSNSPTSKTIRWQISNNGISNWDDIPGETSTTLLVTESMVNNYVRTVVRASNSDGSTSANSNASGKIEPLVFENIYPPVLTGIASETAVLTVTDGEWTENPESIVYNWQCSENGTSNWMTVGNADSSKNTYTIEEDYVGKYIRVKVEASLNEKTVNVNSNTTDRITVIPDPPVNSEAPVITGDLGVDGDLTVSDGVWTNPVNSHTYRWYKMELEDEEWTLVDGATNKTYTVQEEDVGFIIKASVTAINLGGSGVADSEPTGQVEEKAPEVKTIPVISGNAEVGGQLSASNGTWKFQPTSFTYQWQVSNNGTAFSDIDGETTNKLTLTIDDLGKYFRIKVKGVNDKGEATGTSNATNKVIVMPPTHDGENYPEITGYANIDEELTTSNGGWNGFVSSYTYQWKVSTDAILWSNISGAVNNSYVVSENDEGKYIKCVISANNPGGSASVDSDYTDKIKASIKRTLWFWGDNREQHFTNKTTSTRINPPIKISDDEDWKLFVGGGGDSYRTSAFAIKKDGTLWASGDNVYGQLGLGDTSNRNTLTKVGTDNDWKVVFGGSSSFAIKEDGTLWASGRNNYGQLGLGDTSSRNTLTKVGTDNDWKAVFTREGSSFAIKEDGTLWASGNNEYGQLGLGDTSSRNTLTKVGTDNDWKAVFARYSAFAIKEDGTLWASGRNNYGQLGLGDTNNRNTLTKVGTDNDWKVVFGDSSSFAIKEDGTLWASGRNSDGQLGLGDTNDRNTLTKVGTDTNWSRNKMSVLPFGDLPSTTYAIKNNGLLYGCGSGAMDGSGGSQNRTSFASSDGSSSWSEISGMSGGCGVKTIFP